MNQSAEKLYRELLSGIDILEELDTKRHDQSRFKIMDFLMAFLGLIGFIIVIPVGFYLAWELWLPEYIAIGLPIIFVFLLALGLLLINDTLWSRTIKKYGSIRNYHDNLLWSLMEDDSIESVLQRTQEAQKLLRETKELFKRNKNSVLEDFVNKEIQFILIVLHDLKWDIFNKMTAQKLTIEETKNLLQENIKGTPELDAMSSSQQARLDKQIEQFEELQRVLLKV